MKVRTAELVEPALTWVVATLEGLEPRMAPVAGGFMVVYGGNQAMPFSAWSQCGPLIAREIHAFDHMQSDRVCAIIRRKDFCNGGWNHGYGPTPQVAALRCIIESRLGPEVEIPLGLVK